MGPLTLLGSKVFSVIITVFFGRKPKITHHPHPTSTHAVIVMPGLANAGDVAAKTLVPKLLDKKAHVLVVNYPWSTIDSRAIYREIKRIINVHNKLAGKNRIVSISILGSSFGGIVGAEFAEHSLKDGLPFGKIGLMLDGSLCIAANLKWPKWLVKYGGFAVGGILVTLIKAPLSYANSSRAFDDIEPGLDRAHLRWHHARIALFPMPGLAAQIRFVRDFVPSPRLADAVSKAVFVCTPNDPLIDNNGAVEAWRQTLPDIETVTAEWHGGKHAPMAEKPTLQAKYAAMVFPQRKPTKQT